MAVHGESEGTTSDGMRLRLEPGDVLLMDDTIGKGHWTSAVGSVDHVALLIPVPAPK